MTESSSYEDRHARAVDTFTVFVPDAEPERVAASLQRRLGALGGFAFDVVGEMWARPELSRRDRSLIVVSTLAAQARDEELELHTEIAVRNGLTRVEIEEIVVTVAAYAGFPAAMAAIRRVDAGLRAAEGVERLSDRRGPPPSPTRERDRDARDVFAAVSGARAGTTRSPTSLPRRRARRGRRGGLPVGVRGGVGADRAGAAGPLARRHRHPHVARRRGRAGRARAGRRPPRPVTRGDRGGDHPSHPVRRAAAGGGGDACRPRRVRPDGA